MRQCAHVWAGKRWLSSSSQSDGRGGSVNALFMLAGGVDEIVDWSKTAPKRKYKRPADTAGDFDDKVRQEQ